MSLEDGDNDVIEVILVFEKLQYDVCEVFGWFVWEKLARCERFKDLDFKAQNGGFVDNFGFFRVYYFLGVVHLSLSCK